jgi:hypothetical protein
MHAIRTEGACMRRMGMLKLSFMPVKSAVNCSAAFIAV